MCGYMNLNTGLYCRLIVIGNTDFFIGTVGGKYYVVMRKNIMTVITLHSYF